MSLSYSLGTHSDLLPQQVLRAPNHFDRSQDAWRFTFAVGPPKNSMEGYSLSPNKTQKVSGKLSFVGLFFFFFWGEGGV